MTSQSHDVRIIRIIDGDTFTIDPRVGEVDRVRLIGIDTPETRGAPYPGGMEPGGEQATIYSSTRLYAQNVRLELDFDHYDSYSRLLAYIWLPGGLLFNEELLARGLARIHTYEPNIRYLQRFIAAEESAKLGRLGIWGLEPELPTS